MALTLMYITNRTDVALIAQESGVDRIWVDMEHIGKEARQPGLDTVKSHHTIEDVKRIRKVVTKSDLMVRVNPIHEAENGFLGTEEEVERTIRAGADVIMLPYFKRVSEVNRFIDAVRGRCRTMLLVETIEAVNNLNKILAIPGIDEIHIGLNDLHLCYGLDFMFELISNGTVSSICETAKAASIKYGFGGIARIGHGLVPAEYLIAEHYALGSTAAILSRDFCNANREPNIEIIRRTFIEGVSGIRKREEEVRSFAPSEFRANRAVMLELINGIAQKRQKMRKSL